MGLKAMFYDWEGYNKIISSCIHTAIKSEFVVDSLSFISDYIGNYKLFHIHFLVIMVIMCIHIMMSPKNSQKDTALSHLKHASILLFSLCFGYIIIESIKHSIAFDRPFCTPNFEINGLVAQRVEFPFDKCHLSFPSGHASYIYIVVASLWSIIQTRLRIIGVLAIILISLSRVALGMHYLADVLYGVLISAFVCIIVSKVLNAFFAHYHNKMTHLLKRYVPRLG